MTDLNTLSDEELLATDLSSLVLEENDTAGDTVEANTEVSEEQDEQSDTDVPDNTQQSTQEQTEDNTDTSDEEEQSTDQTNQSEEVDYESFYKALTKPIKANGREMQLNNPDDMIRLMQMGANYSKKMEQLKPKQALLKVLEEHSLDNQEQLGYLIDLANKKPEAIAKLIKDSNIDLYDFDTEQAENYQPNLQIAEPSMLEAVIEEVVTDNPQMAGIIDFIGQWDGASKDAIYNEPNIIRAIAQQKQSGLYDRIVGIVEQERMLGRLNGIPYIQAYSQVESQLLQQEQKKQSFTAPRPKNTSNPVEQKRKASIPNGNNQTNSNIAIEQMTDEQLIAMLGNY